VSLVRKLLFGLVLLVFVLLAGVFAYNNPDTIAVDVGFVRLEGVSMVAAFGVVFVLGWVFGLLSAGLALLRMAGERHRLRRDLKFAETELSSLRSLPMRDAN
jgi:putative membrane protein